MAKTKIPIIPPAVTVNTGDESGPRRIAEEFFDSILSFLEYDERAAACFTCREDRALTIFGPDQPIQTDDMIRMLVVKDILAASVIFRRDELNYVRVAYAHYLDLDVIKRIKWSSVLARVQSQP